MYHHVADSSVARDIVLVTIPSLFTLASALLINHFTNKRHLDEIKIKLTERSRSAFQERRLAVIGRIYNHLKNLVRYMRRDDPDVGKFADELSDALIYIDSHDIFVADSEIEEMINKLIAAIVLVIDKDADIIVPKFAPENFDAEDWKKKRPKIKENAETLTRELKKLFEKILSPDVQ